jgi:hypothetical protein
LSSTAQRESIHDVRDRRLRRRNRPAPDGVASSLIRVAACLMLVGACASTSGDDPDVAGAYAYIIEWIVADSASDSDPPVAFVVPQGEGFGIDLSLQAGVISDLEDEVDVRFVDDRTEAFDDGAVRDDGVLIGLGPAVTDGAEVVIDGDETVSIDEVTAWEFRLRRVGDEWSFTAPPTASGD